MSTNARRTKNGSGNDLQPAPQPASRYRILGIDREGYEHVYDGQGRITVTDQDGRLDRVEDISDSHKDVADWMHFVDEERGWAKEQWIGYRLVEAVFGGGR